MRWSNAIMDHDQPGNMARRNSIVSPVQRRAILAGLLAGGASAMGVIPSRLLAMIVQSGGLWSGLPADADWDRFEMATGDTLVVRADVGGSSVAAILDSGSAASLISASLAARLGLDGAEQRTIRGLGGRAPARIVRDLDVVIGRQTRHLAVAYIADLDTASAAFGRPIDFILGQDVLAGRCLALDFANARYALAERFAGGPEWAFAPLGHGSNRELLVPASIAGLDPAPLVVDLGSSTALTLSRNYADQNGLLDGKPRSTAVLGGVDGKRLATTFMVDRTEVAGLGVEVVPALAVDDWLSTSTVGNIGLPLLAQFDVVLDFTAGRLWLHALASGRRLPMLEDHSGLGLAASPNALIVVHIAAGSPAARDGWAIGDRIVAIDGRPVDKSYTRGSLWRWRFGPVGRRVKLTVKGGAVREIRLADYY